MEPNKARLLAWVEALESGEYQQAKESLRVWVGLGDPAYCCLGVATCLAIADGVVASEESIGALAMNEIALPPEGDRLFHVAIAGGYLPPEVQNWLGLDSKNPVVGFYPQGAKLKASSANDELDWSFEEIAAGIRTYYNLGPRPDAS